MLLHVYTCIRYTPDPRAAVVHQFLNNTTWQSLEKKKKKDPQKSVAAMAATAATVPTPLP